MNVLYPRWSESSEEHKRKNAPQKRRDAQYLHTTKHPQDESQIRQFINKLSDILTFFILGLTKAITKALVVVQTTTSDELYVHI